MVNHPRRSKAATTSLAAKATARQHDHEHDYQPMLAGVAQSFAELTMGQTKLFTTDATDLWRTYLDLLPGVEERQVHNCHCCRRFIETYGGLVAIGGEGRTWSVLWNPSRVPSYYVPAFAALQRKVQNARVTGLFVTNQDVWGNPITVKTDVGKNVCVSVPVGNIEVGNPLIGTSGSIITEKWTHLSVRPPNAMIYRGECAPLTSYQVAAAMRENVKAVQFAMVDYAPRVLDEALRVLRSETLARSEKFIGPIEWLRRLHDWPKGEKNQNVRNNIIWRAVAHAPEGFCHIRSSVVGPLLNDIVAGVPFADLQRRHAAKVDPLMCQRPQVAPSEGNVRAAEKLVEQLGIARSLERRFARFEELPLQDAFWSEGESRAVQTGGVFSHIETKKPRKDAVPTVDIPAQTMTWEKFKRTVLISADQINLAVPASGGFYALVTAQHSDAPPIVKWDREEERNPVSWYTYPRGSNCGQWGLSAGSFARVRAVIAGPNMWGTRPMPELGMHVFLILEACADTMKGCGNALFPEFLKGSLHGARSTIEAYSRSATLGGRGEASACGLGFGPQQEQHGYFMLRVLAGNAWTEYRIDRWD